MGVGVGVECVLCRQTGPAAIPISGSAPSGRQKQRGAAALRDNPWMLDQNDHQPDLFGAEPGAAGQPAEALVRIAGPATRLSKPQKEFNRMVERIGLLRAHLGQWQAAGDACRQRAAVELTPLQQRLAGLQRDMVLWIDSYLAQPPQGERLPKKLRAKLVAMLRMLAATMLQAGPDADVEAAHDRHSPQSHREDLREQADLAAAVLGQAIGDERLFEGEAASVEELLQRAAQRLQEGKDSDDDTLDGHGQPAPGRRPSRADQARARDAKALQEASQSVREVYRRLASSLHPDREPDATERTRKTALMARVNEAYGRNDLLALLAVQLDIEQISADHLATVPDARLRHYVLVLKDQQAALETELAGLQLQVAGQRGDAPGLLGWPAKLLTHALDDDLRQMRQAIAAISEDGEALRDRHTRLGFLRMLQVDDPDDAIDPFEEMLLMQSLQDAMAAPPPKARGRGRRR